MRIYCILLLSLALIAIAATPKLTEGQNTAGIVCSSIAKSKPKRNNIKTISAGVVNGRAVRLVIPRYPPAAMAVRVHGPVGVQVLIDENGCVVSAKAVSGHPLLRPNSVGAALQSVFEPVSIGGTPVKVNGLISYIYSTDKLNWLELGITSDSETSLRDFLPDEFEAERELIRGLQSSPNHDRREAFQQIIGRIETKLLLQPTNHWLFKTGSLLRSFGAECWNKDSCNRAKSELKELLRIVPGELSPEFKIQLNELLDETDTTRINQRQVSLVERLYAFGN